MAVATSWGTRKGALAKLSAKSKIQNGIRIGTARLEMTYRYD